MTTANDKQIGGDHYRKHGAFQPWDVLQHWLTPEEYRGWHKGVAIVYLAREADKNGDEDIEKAGHHLHKLLEVIKAQREQGAIDTLNDIAKTADAAGQIIDTLNDIAKTADAAGAIIGAVGDTLKDIHGLVMGREEAFAHAMDECDRAEERAADATSLIGIPAREDKLRWERVNSDKRNEELDASVQEIAEKMARDHQAVFLIPEPGKPYSPNRAPFVKALWEGFTEKHAAQFKALGITGEHLASAGAELVRHLEQPRADHIDPLKP